jgi:hypothetical protein
MAHIYIYKGEGVRQVGAYVLRAVESDKMQVEPKFCTKFRRSRPSQWTAATTDSKLCQRYIPKTACEGWRFA